MSYCLHSDCQRPHNPMGANFCQSCGSKLVLKERYRAIKLIGQGGFGRTVLSVDEDKPSKPRCVIKQFFYQGIGRQKATKLFEQEAVRLDELGKHPQIPELFAHFEQDQYKYLVQEFIDGKNLAEELESNGAFNEDQILQLLNELLPVLEFIHNRKVIHRDIKPENIIRPISGEKLVLVDFGAAKFVTGTAQVNRGTVIGTPEYTSPEQANGNAAFASDLYSLGVTCIHLLTQIPPFDLSDNSENSWVWRDYLSFPVSDSLGCILDKMLEKEVHQRYQSAADVLKALQQVEAEYYYRRGRKKIEQGRYKEAIDDFSQAIAINPNYAEAYYYRGIAYLRLGKNQAAIKDFQKAADLYQQQGKSYYSQKAQSKIRELNSLKYTLESLDKNNQPIVAQQIWGSEVQSISPSKIYDFFQAVTRSECKKTAINDWNIIDVWRTNLLEIVKKIKVSQQYDKDKNLLITKLSQISNEPQLAENLRDIAKDFFVLMYSSLEEKEKDNFLQKVTDELKENKINVKKEDLKKEGLKGILFGAASLSTVLIPIVSKMMLQKMTQGLLGWILYTLLGREALKRAALGVIGGPIGWGISAGLTLWTGVSAFSQYQNESNKAKFIQAILAVYLLTDSSVEANQE